MEEWRTVCSVEGLRAGYQFPIPVSHFCSYAQTTCYSGGIFTSILVPLPNKHYNNEKHNVS